MAQNALITVCPICGEKLGKIVDGIVIIECHECNSTIICKRKGYSLTVEKMKVDKTA